jgi:hypothetical protein
MSWHQRADAAMQVLADKAEPFSANDLRDMVGEPDDTHTANSRNNGIGAVFNAWAQDGRIAPTGRSVRSNKLERKGGRVQEWVGIRPAQIRFDLAGEAS